MTTIEDEIIEAERFQLVDPVNGRVVFSDCTREEADHFRSGKLSFLIPVPEDRKAE